MERGLFVSCSTRSLLRLAKPDLRFSRPKLLLILGPRPFHFVQRTLPPVGLRSCRHLIQLLLRLFAHGPLPRPPWLQPPTYKFFLRRQQVYSLILKAPCGGPESAGWRSVPGATKRKRSQKRLTSHVSVLPGRDGIPREGLFLPFPLPLLFPVRASSPPQSACLRLPPRGIYGFL
jgi:hypothetical protein